MDPKRLTQAIFEPLSPSVAFEYLVGSELGRYRWDYRSWDQPWTVSLCFHQATIWCPPPELARQLLTFLLNSWTECPYTTAILIFVPRVLEAAWRHLSRYVIEWDTIYLHKTPLVQPPLLPIPIVILYIPTHVRSLNPNRRLDKTSRPAPAFHTAEAAFMRGLPNRIPPEGGSADL